MKTEETVIGEISIWSNDVHVEGDSTFTYDGVGWSWEEYYNSILVEQREKTIDSILENINNK